MQLFVIENNVKLGYSAGRLKVKDATTGETVRDLPFADVEGISVYGMAQISTQLIRSCIEKNIPILLYSNDGHYFGHISSSMEEDPVRQKKQVYMTDNLQFCLTWSKAIIKAKIENSIALLRSMPKIYEFSDEEIAGMRHSLHYLQTASTVDEVMGFEGNAAKNYFQCLPKLIRVEDFVFRGRSARPPLDPFNSLLSYGYSSLYRNIIGAIQTVGLDPKFAFLHKLKLGHAALASDLIEEWRSFIVDRTMLRLVNDGMIDANGFYPNDAGAIYMQRSTMKLVNDKLSEVLAKNESYFLNVEDKKRYGFQVALHKKLLLLVEAIEKGDASIYRPFSYQSLGGAL
ncbi:MAG: CRISPR-associated endonuclease Cas1 [Coriobacteriales bacterium]|jgi:CRISPR-associated protein Cas1|nr:CRISPR-associated endonuclease Cas1 [Coriobacteriales bacterium]